MSKCIARSEGDRVAVTVELNISERAPDEIAAMTLNFGCALARFAGNVGDLLINAGGTKMPADQFQEKYLQLGIELFKDIITERKEK